MSSEYGAKESRDEGVLMHAWIRDIFHFPRSITGDGVRQTIRYFQQLMPEISAHEVPSGTNVFDWTIPDEWNLDRAFIVGPDGDLIVDSNVHNLHVVGYSEPIDAFLTLDELQPHLYSLPEQPDAIPYVTSYYAPHWGFCMTHKQRLTLKPGTYRVVVRASRCQGAMTYADLVLPGELSDEILFSTYVCHPMMANNELSGPVVALALARELSARQQRRFTYRFVWAPETIGAIAYLATHLSHLKSWVRAGWVLTCLGDEGGFSYLASRRGDTLADKVALHTLHHKVGQFEEYSFLDRSSDERQYNAPGIDLPVASVMRSKYGTFPEYHTSKDDLSFVTPQGLQGSLNVYRAMVDVLESVATYEPLTLAEPQLVRRGLYPTTSSAGSAHGARTLRNVFAFSDGHADTLNIAEQIGVYAPDVARMSHQLANAGVLRKV